MMATICWARSPTLVIGRADAVVFTLKALGGVSLAERLKVPGLPAQLIPTGPPTNAFRAPFALVAPPPSPASNRR